MKLNYVEAFLPTKFKRLMHFCQSTLSSEKQSTKNNRHVHKKIIQIKVIQKIKNKTMIKEKRLWQWLFSHQQGSTKTMQKREPRIDLMEAQERTLKLMGTMQRVMIDDKISMAEVIKIHKLTDVMLRATSGDHWEPTKKMKTTTLMRVNHVERGPCGVREREVIERARAT